MTLTGWPHFVAPCRLAAVLENRGFLATMIRPCPGCRVVIFDAVSILAYAPFSFMLMTSGDLQ
jgi:hypothetical protein